MRKINQNNTICMDNLDTAPQMTLIANEQLLQEKKTNRFDQETCQDVVSNFKALLEDVDFSQELEIFRLRFYNHFLRKQLVNDFKAVYIGLWALALQTSFPQTYDIIFQSFMNDYLSQFNSLERKITQDKIYSYREMILRSDVRDFNHISKHLLSFVKHNRGTYKADTLRLSLLLRTHYTFIFQRLV